MMRILMGLIGFLFILNSHAWNAMGHQLVAQIAFDHLTPTAKKICQTYIEAYDANSSEDSFVTDASWLDYIRANDIHWYDSIHYIDIPFTQDGTPLPETNDKHHAVWGINQATAILSSSKSSMADKGLSLKILIHIIGDIHQPLHATTRISQHFPKGDAGGNLYKLRKNPIASNLHQYWDKGAGILSDASQSFQLKNKAHQLEDRWSCKQAIKERNPRKWANESHKLAVDHVYTLSAKRMPGKKYQLMAQTISQKQLVSAGCRLAFLLNTLAESG